MHIELTEILVCPDCGPGHGLIAFVDRMEDRRIVAGRLDCSMCERRHEVRDGIVRLTPASPSDSPRTVPVSPGEPPATGRPPGHELPDDVASIVAALLGPPEGPELLLMAAGTRALAPAVADLRPEAAVVTYGGPPSAASDEAASHPRVYPVIVSADTDTAGFPFRAGALDGAVLSGSVESRFVELVAETLSSGGRLVVLSPPSAAAAALSELENVEALAADSRAWVGSRL